MCVTLFKKFKLTKWRFVGRSSRWQGSGDCDLPRGQQESLLSASSEKEAKKKKTKSESLKQITRQTNEPLCSKGKKRSEKKEALSSQPQNGSGLRSVSRWMKKKTIIFEFDGKFIFTMCICELHNIWSMALVHYDDGDEVDRFKQKNECDCRFVMSRISNEVSLSCIIFI